MSRLSFAVIITSLALSGCATMEQYHFPQTQDKVPAEVIVAYSEDHPNEDHPNDVIKSISECKMFDGTTRYTIVATDKLNKDKIVTYTADGKKAG